ncbi:synergin gamma-like isoform X2 [Anneissia japonica]|uniref:synergin gamma-like isoform X2 n=1 Tax=Anneissia japonica TaxID=1529436 RepID=UPI001425A0BF|nr:synergin gamma-like isoform X2 [Anneissia japonica]
MAYRNPQAPSPGRMNMLPGQQQIPMGQQYMQQGVVGGMPRQQYPIMQQGMMSQQMYHQAMYHRQMNPQDFQAMRAAGQPQAYNMSMQGYMMQRGQFPGSMPQQQPVEMTDEMKKKMEKDKKERQFQEQQRRLKSMNKPGVQAGVNPLDDLIGRQLGSKSSTPSAPGGDVTGMMQIGGYMQSQQLPQGNMMSGGMVLTQAGMYQSQPGMMMQAQGMNIQQGIMTSQMQVFQGASIPGAATQLPGTAKLGLGAQQQGMVMSQPSMVSSPAQNILASSNTQQQSANQKNDDFGEFLQGPTAVSQVSSHGQMQTTFSTQVHTVTSQQPPLQTSQSQDEFGSFLQAPKLMPSNPSLQEDDEFGNFAQGPPAAVPQLNPTEIAPALDTSFGEFEKAPIMLQQTEAKSNTIEGRTSPPSATEQTETATTTKAEKKQTGLSLEDMMMQSADLTAPKTTRKLFNQKKSLNEVKTTSTPKTQTVFTNDIKARDWSQTKSLTGLFITPAEENAATQLEEAVPTTADQTISQQEVPPSLNKGYPEWCLNESNLPLVYHQVLEATWNGSEIQTDKLYPILLCSKLEKQLLGHIWSLVNNTQPGQLVKQEMYLALGLIALAQNGVSPLSVEMLSNFRDAPTPQLTPTQSAPTTQLTQTQSAVSNVGTPFPSSADLSKSAGVDDDEFAPFQEAPKTAAENQAIHPNLSSTQPMQFASFDNCNLAPSTFPSSTAIEPPPIVTSFSSNDVISGDLEIVSYIDEEMKSYNLHDPPSRNSSCHSSPVIWGRDTTRDKLWKSVAEDSSLSSDEEEFTEFQSGSGSFSLSLEDRKNDFNDFKDFSSTQDTSQVVVSNDKKLQPAKSSGKKVRSVNKPSLNINFEAYKKSQDNKVAQTLPSSASAPKLTKLAEMSASFRIGQKVDDNDDFADFQTFSAPKSNLDTGSLKHSFQSSKKSESVNDFGNFQQAGSVGFADFDKVKHSASDTDLMALSGEVDKYSALRGISFSTEPEVLEKNNPEGSLASDFDTMSLGSSTGLPHPSGSSGPPLDDFGDFSQASVIKESNDQKQDDGFADFQHFPASSSLATGEADDFANFQTAPTSTTGKPSEFQGFQSEQLNIPGNLDGFADFKSASTSNAQVGSFENFQTSSTDTNDQFASFQSVPVDDHSKKNVDRYQAFTSLQDQDNNVLSIFKNTEKVSENTENMHTNKGEHFTQKSSGNSESLKSSDSDKVKSKDGAPEDDYDDDFGDFKFNEPPPLDDDSFGPSSHDDHFGGFESSVAEYYGVEFDDLSRSNNKIKNEKSFGTYQVSDGGNKKSLGKLESIASLDLKTFDLDLNLGGKVHEEEGDVADDSFGDFSSAPPVPDNVHASDMTVQHPGMVPPGPNRMIPSTPAFGGDRYAMLAGDIQDDARHVLLWKRCLTSCLKVIQHANDTLNNISSSSVCNEVMKSSDGSEYLKGVIEIYRVACRVSTSIQAAGVGTDELSQMQKDIELVWNNLSAFLASASILPDDKSFIFKMAVLHPEPSNINMACGVCLLNVDARSKAFDRAEDNNKLTYSGRQYHATCANLWVNLVDSILPALPFNQLL